MKVFLFVYDLADSYSNLLNSVGLKDVNGLWHTALYLYDMEFEYGPRGIKYTPKDIGNADIFDVIYLGETDVPLKTLLSYLAFLNDTKFKGKNYDPFNFNCNVFTDFLSHQLCGRGIPPNILNTPKTALAKIQRGIAGNFSRALSHVKLIYPAVSLFLRLFSLKTL